MGSVQILDDDALDHAWSQDIRSCLVSYNKTTACLPCDPLFVKGSPLNHFPIHFTESKQLPVLVNLVADIKILYILGNTPVISW